MINTEIIGDEPLVSFVVNCYNGDNYLRKCFTSILTQSYTNWELIFWDNASTDSSAEIFNSYRDPRFKYFRSEHNVLLGQARAWAVEKCSGVFIAFLDVDDEWLPEKTRLQVEGMLKTNAILSYGGIIEVQESSRAEKIITPNYLAGNNFAQNLKQFEIYIATAMISKNGLLRKNLNFDKNIQASEEYCLFMQLIYDENVFVVKEPVAKYLIRGNSLTNYSRSKWADERLYTLKMIEEKNQQAKKIYKNEFVEAYNRAGYYKACYFWSIGDKRSCRGTMSRLKFANWKYFFLFLISYMPFNIWDHLQRFKYKR